jgi:hypothetical protein
MLRKNVTTHLRFVAALVIPFVASGCALVSGCNYETRAVTAEAHVVENGEEIVRGLMNAGGTRGSENGRFLSYDITSSLLYGHIQSVVFTDATNPGVALLNLPFLPQFQPETVRGVLDQRDNAPTPNLAGIFEIIEANRAVLEVRTDLPARPVMNVPFTVTLNEGWRRPNCS